MYTKQEKQKEENNYVNTKKQKSAGFYAIVIMLVLIILVLSGIGIFAWAKYQTTINGIATAQVAKWSFKVNEETEQFATIDLYETMLPVNNIVPERIAPGTSGVILLELDARGSEVAVDYTIKIDIEQKPTNLKMYEEYNDDTYSVEVVPEDGIMTIEGRISLDQVETIQNKYIYWNWPYETGTTQNEINANDKTDTIDSNKGNIELPITVIAVQRDPSTAIGQNLADVVAVGDTVNYNANNNGSYSYTTDSSVTGYSSDKGIIFSSSDTMSWKVMSIDKVSGTVELMAENPTANILYLSGKTGYKNAETVLNDIGAVYGHGKGATGGRSITVEDVNKLENYTPVDDTTTSFTYTSGTFINDDGTEVIATEENSVTMRYTASTKEKSTNGYYNYQTTKITGKPFSWLASRCISFETDFCSFDMRVVAPGRISSTNVFRSDELVDSVGFGAVLPVVSLQSNIQTSGQDESGAWNLIVE